MSGAIASKTCTSSSSLAQQCCATGGGKWSTTASTCNLPVMDNELFRDCIQKAGDTITCNLDTSSSSSQNATAGSSSSAPALRIGRRGALAVAASILLAVMSSV